MFEEDVKYINKLNYNLYCNSNESLLKCRPEAVVLEFPGLGGNSCLGGVMDMGEYTGEYASELAENGMLLLYMFPGPWSWMNEGSVRITDLVLDAVYDKFGLDCNVPVIPTGGSMGGQGAIIFAAESRYRERIRGIAAACPCYDVPEAVFKLDIFPRTFISAVAGYGCSLDNALKKISPVHRINELLKVPYYIVCDEADELFDADGMQKFASALSGKGAGVTVDVLPGLGHGGFTPDARKRFTEFIINLI